MRRLFVAALLILIGSSSGNAQRVTSSLDLSATSVWYADSIRGSGVALAPALRFDWAHATLGGSGEVSKMGQGVSTQALVTPSVFTPTIGPFFAEAAGSFGGSSHQDGTRTGEALAVTRAYAIAEKRGAWLGGGAGRSWDGFSWRNIRQAEFGGWLEHGATSTVVTLTPVAVADSIRYLDSQLALRYLAPLVELGLTAGVRSGAAGPAVGGSSRAWGSLTLERRVASQLAIVATGGTYPIDFTQGYPGGRYVSVTVRVSSGRSRLDEQSLNRTSATTETITFGLRSGAGNQRTLTVIAGDARTVEITGDFTAWEPVALFRGTDGTWSIARAIRPGAYQMNVRINGGPWMVPSGMLSTRDEFGTVTGILVIE